MAQTAALQAKRKELAATEAALVEAEAAMDADAAVSLTQKAQVLRGFITRLEREAHTAKEAAAVEAARAWLARLPASMAAVRARIEAAQAEVRQHVDAAVQAIGAEAAARREMENADTAAEMLAARFGLAYPRTPLPVAAVEDWATPILRVTDAMRPSRSARRRLVISRTAGASAAEIQRATLQAVAEYQTRHGARLPAEVRAILDAAPVPAEVLPAPALPSIEEQRAGAAMAQAVSEAHKALALVPGPMNGTL